MEKHFPSNSLQYTNKNICKLCNKEYEIDIKYEDNLKYKDGLKYEEDLKYLDGVNYEDSLK